MRVSSKSAAAPAAPERPQRPSRTQALIASLIREAPSGAAAWERLMVGVEIERDGDGRVLTVPILMSPERLAANDAAMAVDHRIAAGWGWLAKCGDGPYPRSWVERLKELHAESQERLFDLDAVRIAEAEAAGRPCPDAFACVLSRASQEAECYLQGAEAPPPMKLALSALGQAIDDGDLERARKWGAEYVAQAVEAKYAQGGITEDA